MRKRFTLFFLFALFGFWGVISAQTSSSYFPAEQNHVWYYKVTPLTAKGKNESSAFLKVDSLKETTTTTYQGKSAKRLLSAYGLLNGSLTTPFLDTTYLHFEGTSAWQYLSALPSTLNTSLLSDTLQMKNVLAFLDSLEGWGNLYRFGESVSKTYTVFEKQIQVDFENFQLPVQFKVAGKRLPDQTLSLEAGDFNCKKFAISFGINLIIDLGIFGKQTVPAITIMDSTWIAPNHWIVKQLLPTTKVDLSSLNTLLKSAGLDTLPVTAFTIPGELTELINQPISSTPALGTVPVSAFSLDQNYPNPFNPQTAIPFELEKAGFVSLKIYDILGREVQPLVEKKLSAGKHLAFFNGEKLPSGLYFYKLIAGGKQEIRKMMLVK
ncbi:hypothetical protein Ctha_0101 [Chloroherpeton thalassium ATCC 35110]|uniref:Secretion system C-terminal sorting domain-containing protein n=1 Tax=Chloroherpeton thalassium (strain ATCC 35110 / GB-78) TaxID=517418 RepID=B3QSI1_CHLT3|nr:T9SS type A sorting domain-containing protein [Chloroherpeton thalassium]ACF12572.1 hypothetical protein Ctha_0101 [Chloroherpeton thalassium ATCC 35110]